MSFVAPLFLAGLVALGLPLWLHLLQRENPIRLPFSSIKFFEKRKQSTMMERRFRYLLLMGLRLALLALAVLAFAKPIWQRAPTTATEGFPALHLIVLDTSLSMQYDDRFAQAQAAAEAIVDSMTPADQAQILTMGPSVSVITERLTDPVELKEAVRSLAPGVSRNSYGDAVEAARSLAPEADTRVELHLLTDAQNSAMPGRFSDLVLPTLTTLDVQDFSGNNDQNWAVESVRGTLRMAGAETPRLEVSVAGFALEPARRTVTLKINGAVVSSQTAEVPSMGRASFLFENFEAPKGFSRAEIVLAPADDMPADDHRWAVLDNSDPAPVLFVTRDQRRRDSTYFRAALQASSAAVFDVRAVSPGEAARLNPNDYALVVLSDAAGTALESKLTDYVEGGGSVVVAVGSDIAGRGKTPILERRVAPSKLASPGGYATAGQVDQSHPALGRVEELRGVKFFRYARLAAEEGDDTPALFADGSPLWLEREVGAGRVVLLASSLDNVWNDLPVLPLFVPFAAETARYLSGSGSDSRQAVVDQSFELRRRRNEGESVQVIDPNGDRALTLSQSSSATDLPLTAAGFYELRSPDRTELIAVNPDPRESNLRPIESDTLALWQETGRAEGEIATEGEETLIQPPPIRLWKWFLFLLAAAVLLESVVANRHLNVRREV